MGLKPRGVITALGGDLIFISLLDLRGESIASQLSPKDSYVRSNKFKESRFRQSSKRSSLSLSLLAPLYTIS